ncbi:AAA family ATPase [Blastopirellula sp. JC732]|uniref:AAA family ATPase n=1 Tax=Blastopirellula sediminis TaxID=2894196 RepID=A0A9X1SHT8_9BACT|nr:AAA family ATPase [Blastopirellula sediminis]MCC9607713.1 AAA family ATPase [Blastopirellula sediminis]MCC9627494.1 AAA family ATPase [Blastopirellula sediminis]
MTIAELLSRRDSPGWLLSGMLRQREAAVILGPSRCLKTSLAVDLGAALASGGAFLGEFAAEQAFRVGFVGGEAAQAAVMSLAERRGDLAALEQIVWAFNLVEPSGAVNMHRLSDWIARNQLEVVLIDAADLAPMTRRAEAAQLRALADCCLAAGATPIVCCRTRKEIKPRAMDAADLADSPCGAIARQWLLVNRREAFEPGSGLHRLWLTFGASSGRSGQWGVDINESAEVDSAAGQWEATIRDVASIELEAAEVEAQTLADRLWWRLRCVMQQIDPANATKLKIRELSGMSGGKFGVTWDRMVADGEIVLAPGGMSKEPRYRLVDLAEKIACSPVHSPAAEETEDAAESSPPEKKSQSSPLPAEESGPLSPLGTWFGDCLSLTTAELLALSKEEQKKTTPSPVQSPRNGPRRRPKRKKRRR